MSEGVEEHFLRNNPDGSVTLDAYAGKSRDELKVRCRELVRALSRWQFIAISAATSGGNMLNNVPEPDRSEISNLLEAYSDDDSGAAHE